MLYQNHGRRSGLGPGGQLIATVYDPFNVKGCLVVRTQGFLHVDDEECGFH
jgi:hypothetical protein